MLDEQEVQGIEINDPKILSSKPDGDFDSNAVPKFDSRPLPPTDKPETPHLVALWLDEEKEGGAVYAKADRGENGEPVNIRVVAALKARIKNADGSLGPFLSPYYATTVLMAKQKASSLSGLCYLAGRPLPSDLKTVQDQINFVVALFHDAGDEGVQVYVRTRWTKRVPVFDEDGMPVYEGQYLKRNEIKGEGRIRAHALLSAQQEVAKWTQGEDESAEDYIKRKQEYIQFYGIDNPHIFEDPLGTGDLKYVYAEIAELLDV